MIFQAKAWSDIFLSESDIANFVCSDIIFASKTRRSRISHGKAVYQCVAISLAAGEYNCGTLLYEVCHYVEALF